MLTKLVQMVREHEEVRAQAAQRVGGEPAGGRAGGQDHGARVKEHDTEAEQELDGRVDVCYRERVRVVLVLVYLRNTNG